MEDVPGRENLIHTSWVRLFPEMGMYHSHPELKKDGMVSAGKSAEEKC